MYMAGVVGRLRVCLDDINQCPFERRGKDIRSDSRQWTLSYVQLNAGTHTVC